jgi:hypothetical protein
MPKTTFTEAEFTPPEGLGLFCMIVPNAMAPIGMTFDGDMLPMLEHSNLFHIVVSVTRDGAPYTQDGMGELQSFVDLGLMPAGDGLSHRILRDIMSQEFGDGSPAAGNYEWSETLTDSTGDGWQVNIAFTVQ